MKAYVNDFLTVTPADLKNADSGLIYVNITDFNSVTIYNTGLTPFSFEQKFTIYPFEKFVINGKDFENLNGNLYIQFRPSNILKRAIFIRKKFIHAKL